MRRLPPATNPLVSAVTEGFGDLRDVLFSIGPALIAVAVAVGLLGFLFAWGKKH